VQHRVHARRDMGEGGMQEVGAVGAQVLSVGRLAHRRPVEERRRDLIRLDEVEHARQDERLALEATLVIRVCPMRSISMRAKHMAAHAPVRT
jgi:hypothetical protein